jgi:hypothetical protein
VSELGLVVELGFVLESDGLLLVGGTMVLSVVVPVDGAGLADGVLGDLVLVVS